MRNVLFALGVLLMAAQPIVSPAARPTVVLKSEGSDRILAKVDLIRENGIDKNPKAEATARLMYTRPLAQIVAGGSGGGGKSHTLRFCATHFALWLARHGFPGEKLFYGSMDYPGLRDRVIGKFIKEYGEFGEITDDKEFGYSFKFADPKVARICWRNMADPNGRKGSEFAAGFIEELTETIRKIYGAIQYMVRQPGLPYNPIVSVTNPDGVGHEYVKALWQPHKKGLPPKGLGPKQLVKWALDQAAKAKPLDKRIDEGGDMDVADYIYLPYLPQDNPTFELKRWRRGVENLPRHIQLARWSASWDTPEGARWPDLDEAVHLFNLEDKWPKGIPEDAYRIIHVDWGLAAPYCALWTIEEDDGDVWTYQEHYEAGLIASKQVESIRLRTGEHDIVKDFVGDPAMNQRRKDPVTGELEPSMEDIYVEGIKDDARFACGFRLPQYGKNDSHITQKLATLDEYLDYTNGKPNWHIEENCLNLWGELKGAVFAKGNGLGGPKEKLDPNCPLHAISAGYFGLHKRKSNRKKPTQPTPGEAAAIAVNEHRQALMDAAMQQVARNFR